MSTPSEGSPRGAAPRSEGDRLLHAGRVFDLVERASSGPGGHAWAAEVVLHPGAVAVVALDESGRVLVVEQERPALQARTLEIPAGRLEPGEDPREAAARELEEETGLRAESLTLLHTVWPAPGFCSEQVHLFEARGLRPAGPDRLQPDADEDLVVRWSSPADLIAQRPVDAKTLLAALHAQGSPIGHAPAR